MKLFEECYDYIDSWFDAFNKLGETGNSVFEALMKTYAIKVEEKMSEIENAGLGNMFYNEANEKYGYTFNNINFIRGKVGNK